MPGIDGLIQKSLFSGSCPQSGGNKLDDIANVSKISNSGLNSMMEIIKVLEDHDILPKGITKTAKNEVNSQRGGLLPILLGGLASSLIGNFLSKELFGGSGIKRAGEGI